MARGRRPYPPKVRAMLGKKPTKPTRHPEPTDGPGPPPANLTQQEHMVWWDLASRGSWLMPKDAPKLELVSRQLVRVRKLAAISEKRGIFQRDKNRPGGMERIAPWERLRQREEQAANKILTELGFTPGSAFGNVPSPDTRSVFERMLDADCPGHRTGQPWPSDEEIAAGLAQPPNFIVPKS